MGNRTIGAVLRQLRRPGSRKFNVALRVTWRTYAQLFFLAVLITGCVVFLRSSWASRLLTTLGAQPEKDAAYFRVPILLYHDIDGRGRYSITRHEFRRHLEILREEKIDVIPLRTLLDHARNRRPFARPTIVITIDDDYANAFRVAAPLLREFQFPAAFFVYVRDIQRSPEEGLSWDDIDRIRNEGFEIQNHSYSHTAFHVPGSAESAAEYRDRVSREIETSRRILEQRLPGNSIYAFAYPMGLNSPMLRRELEQAGYALLLTTQGQSTDISQPFTGTLDRFTIQSFYPGYRDSEHMIRDQIEVARTADGAPAQKQIASMPPK